jgi:beta-lactam-binding protein with PASTA domain
VADQPEPNGVVRVDQQKKSVKLLSAVIGASAVVAMGAVTALAGTGVAGAATPDVTGQTFSKASAALSAAGFKVVVATTIGTKKSQPDCIVTGEHTISKPQNGSHPSSSLRVLLSLNCS